MKKRYRLPIVGTVLSKEPLTGDAKDPVRPIDISELMPKNKVIDPDTNEEREVPKYSYAARTLGNFDYNVDDECCEAEIDASKECHAWLGSILPQLNDIKKAKGWKLDKTKLEKK